MMETLQAWGPLAAWLGIALGSLVGVPVTPMYLALGMWWGVAALPAIALGLVVHLLMSWWLTHSVVGPWIEKLLHRFPQREKIYKLAERGPRQVTVLVRLIPGLPPFAQSYFLCLIKVPLGIYIVWSLALQLAWATGVVMAGEGWMKGQGWLAGVGLLAAGLFVWITQYYARRAQPR